MRYFDLHLQRVGLALGAEREHVRDALTTVRYSPGQAARTGQISRAAALGWIGPQLAAVAGRRALTGGSGECLLHLHSTINDPGHDFWSANSYVARNLGLRDPMTLGVNAMSNSMVLSLEVAATMLSAWPGRPRAVVTSGDVFAEPRFPPWSADRGMVYGDAGSAAVVGSEPGLARILSACTVSDTGLEVLNRGRGDSYANATQRPPINLATLKREAVQQLGGSAEVDRRNAACVMAATKTALHEAECDLSELTAVFGPHYGADLAQRHLLDPLGVATTRTAAEYGRQVGHLGANDQIAALQHWCISGRLQPGDRALLLGIGVGMSYTAALLQITDPTAVAQESAAPPSPPSWLSEPPGQLSEQRLEASA